MKNASQLNTGHPFTVGPVLAARFDAIEKKAVETLKMLGPVTTDSKEGGDPDSLVFAG